MPVVFHVNSVRVNRSVGSSVRSPDLLGGDDVFPDVLTVRFFRKSKPPLQLLDAPDCSTQRTTISRIIMPDLLMVALAQFRKRGTLRPPIQPHSRISHLLKGFIVPPQPLDLVGGFPKFSP
jgi:hypothetical protein